MPNAENGSTIGYTLNLYLTNNTLLLNGKDLVRFMNVHLPLLHEIMCISVEQFRNVATLNNLLAERMQQLLDQRANLLSQKVVHKGQQPSDSDIESVQLAPHIPQCSSPLAQNNTPTIYACDVSPSVDGIQAKVEISSDPADITCTRCKRSCKTRAAVCQVGNHWIHYRCDRLTTDEIDRLHNDIGFIYTCKNCQKNNTTVKTLCDSDKLNLSRQGSNPSNDINIQKKLKRCNFAPQLKIPKLTCEQISSPESAATDLLLEELSHPCWICNCIIAEDDAACLKGNHICHSTCMDPDNSDICVSCAATDNQIQVQHTPNTESYADKSSIDIISKQPVIKSTSSENSNQTSVNSIDKGSVVVSKPSSESAKLMC